MIESNTKTTLVIEQDGEGYRYSTEPFLLAHFVRPAPGARVLDVGAGCGIISLLLAVRDPGLEIVAVEIQKPLYELALRNVRQNGFSGKIRMVLADFAQAEAFANEGPFDAIVSNPPYRKVNSGRLNPNRAKALARHELTLTLPALAENGRSLLKSGGKIALAYPPYRLGEVREELVRRGLFPRRLRFVHGYRGTPAKIFLIEAVKERSADCVTEPPLYIYNTDGSYTPEMQEIYASFNYSGRSHRLREKRDRHCAG